LLAEGTVYLFARTLDPDVIVIAVNIGSTVATASIKLQTAALARLPETIIFGSGQLKLDAGEEKGFTLELPPRSGCILH
jgi:hypothetical protein